ncbi:hypothetical protein HYH03_000831 [Edaphochlamys debaryana]|uniref:Uncharacterized protein n=1 Tax=Edaphochlamys debaryana TaxID=47281 RepID=A0A836C598_9CHLO|nr:hypothetical protein HYH03_000831 [Edaphochlamys debaryana]|eukprot:KAG2501011.1 hypothetical protein HYH03_000831 [Edaphochlamys debaryana]
MELPASVVRALLKIFPVAIGSRKGFRAFDAKTAKGGVGERDEAQFLERVEMDLWSLIYPVTELEAALLEVPGKEAAGALQALLDLDWHYGSQQRAHSTLSITCEALGMLEQVPQPLPGAIGIEGEGEAA